MHAKDWSVCLIEPNKFEAKIIVDLLRNAGVTRLLHIADSEAAFTALELKHVNVIIAAVESAPLGGVEWTRQFRRNHRLPSRKSAIFLTSGAFSRAVAEQCRHAGANALIGKPVSGKTLIATITKVLAHPREFIDAAGYVGPCRRAGIVTAGPTNRRRKADSAPAPAPLGVEQLAERLRAAVAGLLEAKASPEECAAAVEAVQSYAKACGDGPMLRACAALSLQIAKPRGAAGKSALHACAAKIMQIAQAPASERELREALAEQARQAVAKAMDQAA